MSALILVVDDNPANLKLACDVLAAEGNQVLRAENAERALEVLEGPLPDLILMDISMPGMDGLTLTRKLKADARTREIVVVALTASAMRGDEDRVMAAGCDGYIAKPIDTRTFGERVASFVKSRPRARKCILVVDDNATNRKLLRAILQAEDVNILDAEDGLEALSILESRRVDVVISDILMPRMDGYRLCLEIRKSDHLRSMPFIFCTSTYTSPGDRQLALDMGADRFITKPASARAVLEAVGELESRSGPAPTPTIDASREVELIKEYSEQLVAKLEERNLELTQVSFDLHATNEKLHHLLAHSPAVFYGLKLENGSVIPHVVSENITELLGFDVRETLSYDWWAGQLHPDDRERAIESLSDTVASSSSRTEYRIRHKNGSYRWVEDNRRLIRDADDRPQEIVGLWADITERRQLEAEIDLRDQRLGAFFSNATAGLCILDNELRYVQVNETLAKMNGVAVEEHLGRTLRDVLPNLAPAVEPILRKVLDSKGPVLNAEIVGTTPAQPDVPRHWMASYFPLMREQGTPTGIGSVVVEVTEQKSAQEALRLSEAKFRQLAEHIPEVFWMTSPDMSEIVYVSPAYEKIWGRSLEHLYEHPHDWVDAIVPEDRQHVSESFGKLAEGVAQVNVEYRIRRPDGSVRWLLDRGFPVRDEFGKLYRTTGIVKDITEQKHLEESLRRAQKMEAIGQLAGGIAHDFNNILGCILGYTELAVIDAAGNDAAQSDLQEVLKASQRAKELVLQILTFSRQQAKERRPVRLHSVIKEALKLLRASLPSTIDIDPDLGDESASVVTDETQIHQIMMNLVTNAAHAMNGSGKLDVNLAAVHVDEDVARTNPDLRLGDYVRLSVTDTGCGMDRATVQRVFDPFFTTKAPGEGTGLGLAVVHGIMKSHEGAITVYSEPGKGTAFHLYFPAHGSGDVDVACAIDALPRGAGERVLLVDDEPSLAHLGCRILERAGYRVTVQTNPLAALAVFRAGPNEFDLIITDLTMPNMNGIDLAAELLKIRPDLPVIMATGFGGSMTHAKARELGIQDLLIKPINAHSLVTSAHRTLLQTKGA